MVFVLDLADYMHFSENLKENYFYSFLIFTSKILINAKTIFSESQIKLSEKDTKSFKEYLETLKEKLNKIILFEDLFDLETFGILEMFKQLLILLKCEKEEFFKEFLIKKQLLPLHAKAQSMVTFDKDHDLIMLCFPIDDEELIIDNSNNKNSKKAGKGANEYKDSALNKDKSRAANEEKNEKFLKEDEKIIVNKNLYTPNN